MPRYRLVVNGKQQVVEASAETPLLWVLRDDLGLTGTKFGCGQSLCGACTVHLDGVAVRSCQTTIKEADGHRVTTIEGLAPQGAVHPLQQAWASEEVPQCGYCQSGQLMAAAALLATTPRPTDADIDADIDAAMDGILCRCGTYNRIRRAIHRVAGGTP
jgi:isoquinoline 1-oxidoreductase subunit alpha